MEENNKALFVSYFPFSYYYVSYKPRYESGKVNLGWCIAGTFVMDPLGNITYQNCIKY